MSRSTKLFELIKSLSKTEKRHFKLYVGKHQVGGQNNYLKLFEIVDRQSSYDEAAIKKKLAGSPIAKRLAVEKSYLYNLILRSLRVYHGGKSKELEVLEILEYINILFARQLYDQCYQHIKKAKKIAEENDLFHILAQILDWEEVVLITIEPTDYFIQNDRIRSEKAKVLEKLKNMDDYIALRDDFYKPHILKGIIRKDEEEKVYDELFDNPLLKDDNTALTTRARFYFFDLHARYYRGKGDFKKFLYYRERLVSIIRKDENYISLRGKTYLTAMSNLALAYIENGRYKDCIGIVDQMKADAASLKGEFHQKQAYDMLNHAYTREFNMYRVSGQFHKGVEQMDEVTGFLDNWERYMSEEYRLEMYYSFAVCYFGAGQFKDALGWLHKILNFLTGETRNKYVFTQAMILNLITHFELGNDLHLEYVVQSVYRHLIKRKEMFEVESAIIRFIRKDLPKMNTRKEQKEGLQRLHKRLSEIMKDPREAQVLTYFDYLGWLESKIGDRSFAEIASQRKPPVSA